MYLNFLWSFLKTQSQVKNQDVAKKPTVCRSTDDIITRSEGWSGSGGTGWKCRLSKLCWVTGSSSVGRASGVESSGVGRASGIESSGIDIESGIESSGVGRASGIESSDASRSSMIGSSDSSDTDRSCIEVAQFCSSSSWTWEVEAAELFSTPLAYQLHQLIFNL